MRTAIGECVNQFLNLLTDFGAILRKARVERQLICFYSIGNDPFQFFTSFKLIHVFVYYHTMLNGGNFDFTEAPLSCSHRIQFHSIRFNCIFVSSISAD